jgi:processive 1,2-diacylglycerol beta-glucosyltransferase
VAIRILVTYATAGAGHRRAAEAIAAAARAQLPAAQVQCVDILDYTPAWFRRGYSWSYLLLVRHAPWVWGISYRLLDRGLVYRCFHPLRQAWNLLLARRFVRWLKEEPPGLVVATHFFPANVCGSGKRRGWLRVPVVVVVTDFHPHRFWLGSQFDAVVLGAEQAAAVCVQRGLPRQRLHVLGIPVRTCAGTDASRQAGRSRLDLEPHRQVILVASGGTTVGPFEQVVGALTELEQEVPNRLQLLVVCGEDVAALRRLQERARKAPMPIKVFGFVDNMPELMAASDLMVAKAGGMTVAEALGQGLPLVLYHAIPGQERSNAQYLAQHGAAVIARRPSGVAAVVRRMLEHPDQVDAMRKAAKRLGRPQAAAAIVSEVLRPLLIREVSTPTG